MLRLLPLKFLTRKKESNHMTKTILISRPASGSGTVVTVTLKEDGLTAKFALRAATTRVRSTIRAATNYAQEMLDEAKAEIANPGGNS